MATKKITELSAGTALDGSEVVAAVQSNVTKKITLGTAADKTVGTSSGNLVQLGSGSTLPAAIDGSLLTGIPISSGALTIDNNLSDLADVASARNTLGVEIGADVQAQHAQLQQIADGVTSAEIAQLKNIGTSIVTSAQWTYVAGITAFGASLVDDADAGAGRSTLGVVIGTNVQAWDAELAAFAGLTSAVDKLPYFTNSGTMGVTDITSSARVLVSKSMAALTSFIVAASDETTNITSGGDKVAFRMPFPFTAIEVRASLTTAQTSAADIFTVDIHQDGTTILSTKITIDDTEKTSKTAVTPPVISSASLADDAEITVDVDSVGAGSTLPKGLKVAIIGHHQ